MRSTQQEAFDRERADDDQRKQHDEADEGAASVREDVRHLEGEDEDRLQDKEGNQIGDGAETRDRRRDDQIGDEQDRHRHDQHAIVPPQPATADRLLAFRRLEHRCRGPAFETTAM